VTDTSRVAVVKRAYDALHKPLVTNPPPLKPQHNPIRLPPMMLPGFVVPPLRGSGLPLGAGPSGLPEHSFVDLRDGPGRLGDHDRLSSLTTPMRNDGAPPEPNTEAAAEETNNTYFSGYVFFCVEDRAWDTRATLRHRKHRSVETFIVSRKTPLQTFFSKARTRKQWGVSDSFPNFPQPHKTKNNSTFSRKIVNNVVTRISTPYSVGPLPCPYACGRSFKHATQKAIHVRKAHTGERPFVCGVDGCERAFHSSGDLKVRVHCFCQLVTVCPHGAIYECPVLPKLVTVCPYIAQYSTADCPQYTTVCPLFANRPVQHTHTSRLD
jgi:hypothetical protein